LSTLIEQLLEEQQDLTAVERFSQLHGDGSIPAQQQYYSKLLPAAAPAPGQQYAFQVDLDKCSGCKACVTACHNLNGLDESEAWRDVGLLVGGSAQLPIMQHVTTACHHCVEPACAEACPVDAYEKNPVTGIVRHLDDQCFGCQYCTLACPYEVPKYHAKKGIVRKCDMCSERLADGEAPACVQSCPHEAISINVIDVAEVRNRCATDTSVVPTAPASDFTLPTTIYTSRKDLSETLVSADQYSLKPQHAHWPLVIMLVLTQLSVGMFATGLLIHLATGSNVLLRAVHATVALVAGLAALGASTCHLGRPQYAFRAFIGLRHSWLSREIVVFGAFAGAAVTFAGLTWLSVAPSTVVMAAELAAIGSGLAGILCSVMIYVFTRRQFWSLNRTATRFLLTCPILGVATSWLTLTLLARISVDPVLQTIVSTCSPWFAAALVVASVAKLGFEASLFAGLKDESFGQLKRSAMLMSSSLCKVTVARFVTGVLGGIVLPLIAATLAAGGSGPVVLCTVGLMFVGCVAGEILERYLFFAAVSPDKMPGGL
jgi:Fe-S-cluster-containing dehydrogenase component/DMSO reductase anchor subunit